MSLLNKMSIGTKLAIIPIVAIGMVIAMTVGQVIGNMKNDAAEELATLEQAIAYEAAEAKAATRGMMVGVRDIRLAKTPEALKNAQNYVATRQASLDHYVDAMMAKAVNPENRGNMEKLKAGAAQYAATGLEMVQLKIKVFSPQSRPNNEGEVSIASINAVNGGAKAGQCGGVKAGQWREDAPTCKGARLGPFACRRRKLFRS